MNEVFLKEQESFEIERNKEDENLKILELKENEESKKKDSIDLDLLYPLNYSSTLSNKYKVIYSIYFEKTINFSI